MPSSTRLSLLIVFFFALAVKGLSLSDARGGMVSVAAHTTALEYAPEDEGGPVPVAVAGREASLSLESLPARWLSLEPLTRLGLGLGKAKAVLALDPSKSTLAFTLELAAQEGGGAGPEDKAVIADDDGPAITGVMVVVMGVVLLLALEGVLEIVLVIVLVLAAKDMSARMPMDEFDGPPDILRTLFTLVKVELPDTRPEEPDAPPPRAREAIPLDPA